MTAQWDSALYEESHSFVWKMGAGLIPLLNPQPGERILDLGCGTGQLTAEIAASGANVTGLDSSVEMIGQARRNFPALSFGIGDARHFQLSEPCDAVFSNAVLHWVTEPELAIESISRALKPGGRFVAEFGGKGNVAGIVNALFSVLTLHGYSARSPWYYPSVAEYTALLEKSGFEIRFASLFERPTELIGDDGLKDWIRMFGSTITAAVPAPELPGILDEVCERARPHLFRNGHWYADYKRLRISSELA